MKSIKKLLFVMAALAAVFGFVACSNDDDGGPSRVAVYEDKATFNVDGYVVDYIQTLTFYNDNTFSWVNKMEYHNGPTEKMPYMDGEYTGDPSKDGTITMAATEMYNGEGKKTGVTGGYERKVQIQITDGKFSYSNGKFTRK